MYRALIVEDEAISALALSGMLEDAGWKVTGVAASGERALEMALSDLPDLVLMDIQLRGALSGLEVATRLVEEYGVPVIFTTAYTENEVLGDGALATGFRFLAKPVSEASLEEMLSSVVGPRRTGESGPG
jgi:CheY-like chemotaxis protein